jgi:hypothetical protein
MTAKELAEKTIKDIAKIRQAREGEVLGYMKERHGKRKANYYRKNMGSKY